MIGLILAETCSDCMVCRKMDYRENTNQFRVLNAKSAFKHSVIKKHSFIYLLRTTEKLRTIKKQISQNSHKTILCALTISKKYRL